MSAQRAVSLVVRQMSMSRGARELLQAVDLTVTERSRMAVVGPNGVGKSTLLQLLAEQLSPDAGRVEISPPAATVGLVRQELDRRGAPTVRRLLEVATGIANAQAALESATEQMADGRNGADEVYAVALERYLASGAVDFDTRLGEVAGELAIPDRVLDQHPAVLSGGEAARVGLAVVLLSRFDITLLDEPTNDLDLAALDQLEQWVANHRGGLVIVSHDREFLERTVSSVLEIDEHHHTVQLFQGGWSAFLQERAVARSQAEQRHATYTSERDRLAARAQTQREWAAQGARRAKAAPTDGDKHVRAHNLAQTEKLLSKAKLTQRAIDRLEVVEKPWEGWQLRFDIDQAPRSSNVVAALDAAVVSRPGFELGPLSMELHWAERLALLGRNGSGKSTLIELLLGRLEPTTGNATLGSRVVVGELDQRRRGFERGDTALIRVFEDATGMPIDHARSVLAKFGLDARAVERPAASLSPGERTRAQLAMFQARGVNLLVLDEPTNHLDLQAIEQLESALATYSGTLLLVSHDRRFLQNVQTTRSISLDP